MTVNLLHSNIDCSYQNHQRNLRERQQQLLQQNAAENADVPRRDADNEDVVDGENADNANSSETNDGTDGNVNPSETLNQDATQTNDAETLANTTQSSSSSAEQEDNNRLPTVTLLRTFVLSFFASLIPETPAV